MGLSDPRHPDDTETDRIDSGITHDVRSFPTTGPRWTRRKSSTPAGVTTRLVRVRSECSIRQDSIFWAYSSTSDA